MDFYAAIASANCPRRRHFLKAIEPLRPNSGDRHAEADIQTFKRSHFPR